jgi:hypothetical protein
MKHFRDTKKFLLLVRLITLFSFDTIFLGKTKLSGKVPARTINKAYLAEYGEIIWESRCSEIAWKSIKWEMRSCCISKEGNFLKKEFDGLAANIKEALKKTGIKEEEATLFVAELEKAVLQKASWSANSEKEFPGGIGRVNSLTAIMN